MTYGSYITRSLSALFGFSALAQIDSVRAKISRKRARSSGGRRVVQQSAVLGAVLNICAMSTQAWRAIANVSRGPATQGAVDPNHY